MKNIWDRKVFFSQFELFLLELISWTKTRFPPTIYIGTNLRALDPSLISRGISSFSVFPSMPNVPWPSRSSAARYTVLKNKTKLAGLAVLQWCPVIQTVDNNVSDCFFHCYFLLFFFFLAFSVVNVSHSTTTQIKHQPSGVGSTYSPPAAMHRRYPKWPPGASKWLTVWNHDFRALPSTFAK